jgi:hypothetical protein
LVQAVSARTERGMQRLIQTGNFKTEPSCMAWFTALVLLLILIG